LGRKKLLREVLIMGSSRPIKEILMVIVMAFILLFMGNVKSIAADRAERMKIVSSIDNVIKLLNTGGINEAEAVKQITAIIPKPKNFPTRNIEFVVPWGEGGGSDRYARTIGRDAEKFLPVSFVYKNMAGAAGEVGYAYLLTQPPDGHTIYGMTLPQVLHDALGETPYSFTDDTTYIISNQGPSEAFWVRADEKRFKTWEDVVKYAKENPKKLIVSASATKSDDEFMLVQLQDQLGIEITHLASDKSGQRQANLLGGHADILHESTGPVIDLYRGGKIRPILYLGSKRFTELDPSIPCGKDVGLNLTIIRFRGITGPPGMPRDITEYLYYVLYAASQMPGYKKFEVASSLHYSQPWSPGLEDFEKLCKDFKQTALKVIEKHYK
jgi:tripartite-type tricarboxylate transporter receptor subunit TctC